MKNLLLVSLLLPICLLAQTREFKLVSYNSLRYSPTNVDARHPYFRTVMNDLQPDLLVLQELSGLASADQFLDSVMNIDSSTYTLAPFTNSNDLDIALYYKTNKFTYRGNQNYPTILRDIYQFSLSPINSSDTLHIFGVHLKASTGTTNQNRRKAEVDTLRKVTDALPPNSYFVVCGDFNIYSANEPAYAALLQTNSGTNGEFNDLFNLSGTWNNASYAAHHTQSPRDVAFNGGASGGMDDRFDMILLSDGINNTGGINYKTNSYNAYGNDGNHYNTSINSSPTNTAVGQTIADALYYASDHIPVEATFEYNGSGGSSSSTLGDTILLAEYDRANNSGCVNGIAYTAPDVSVKNLCRSSGVVYNSSGGDYNTRDWPQVNILSPSSYLEFAVAPSSNKKIFLSELKIRFDRSSTGPSEVVVRSNLDNYSTDLVSISSLSTSGITISPSINLSSSDTIIFRVYAYNATSSSGTFDIEGFAGTNIVDPGIQLKGFVVPNYIWDGNSWNTASAPDGDLKGGDITIEKGNSAANIATNTTAYSVIIESGAALELDSNASLTVQDTIYVKDGGNGYAQVKGNVIGNALWEHRNNGPSTNWYYISFPLDATIANVSSNQMTLYTAANGQISRQNIYYYFADTINPTNNEGIWLAVESLSKSIKSTAYNIFQGPPQSGNFPITLSARGSLNSGDQTFNLKYQTGAPIENRGWNLIPNPFPCALDWSLVKAQNSTLDAAFYIERNDVWYAHNGSVGDAENYIAPGQSFLVKTSSASSITLTESMITVTQYPNRFKSAIDYLELSIGSPQTSTNKTWIGFDQSLSFGLDKDFDGLKRFNSDSLSTNLYSLNQNGESFVFNGIPSGLNSYSIPLEFTALLSGTYSLNLTESLLNNSYQYHLVDHQTNDTSIYLPSSPYQFTYTGGNTINQYTLLINASDIGLDDPLNISKKWVSLNKNNGNWEIVSLKGEPLLIWVTDLSGKIITETHTISSKKLSLKKGIYILEVYNQNTGDKFTKKIGE